MSLRVELERARELDAHFEGQSSSPESMQTTDKCEQESRQPNETSTPPQAPEPAGYVLDCYPYTFSPLLLFAQSHYFDKGYSNYNSVAKFFEQAVEVDMLSNVLYERKNMLYEDLLEHVTNNMMLVTCCIGTWAFIAVVQ